MARADAVLGVCGNAPVEWPIGQTRKDHNSMRHRLRYIQHWTDRRTGIRYARFRRRGYPNVMLPGLIGSPEFMVAYHACLRGEEPQKAAAETRARTGPATISAAVALYLESTAFTGFGEATCKRRASTLRKLCTLVGDKPIALIDRKYIDRLLESIESPIVRRTFLLTLRPFFAWAVKQQMLAADPSSGIVVRLPKSDGHATWSDAQVSAFESRWAISTKERLALALLVHTGQRRGDVIRIGRQHIRDGILTIKQRKTGAEVSMPVHPELAAAIAASPSEHLTFLVTSTGRPYSEREFNRRFRAAVDAAGLPANCVPHGLRKACCRRLAEMGCTTTQIAAISGHMTLKEIQRYCAAFDRKLAAKDAMAKLVAGARP